MSQKIVLLVEDDPDDELLMLMAFGENRRKEKVAVVRDGLEALDFLFGIGEHTGRDLSAMPALIILDLKLPRMDGIEVLSRIRSDERTRLIPVVILTSSNQNQDMVDCYRLCANSYLQKPFEFSETVDLVRRLGEYWLDRNHVPANW